MAKFIDPFTDTGFKIIFGQEHVSEELLLSFLKVLFADDPTLSNITSVRYLPSERIREWDEGKSIIYDIHCETSSGHRFILEMQLNAKELFLKRAFYYFCRSVAAQGYKGTKTLEDREQKGIVKHNDIIVGSSETELTEREDTKEIRREAEYKEYWDYDFVPVIAVIFSNFFIDGLEEKLVTFGKFMDAKSHTTIGDYIQSVFIQLPAFDKPKEKCTEFFDQWIYNLTHMSTMETMAFTSHQDIFNRLAQVANLATLSPAERAQYDYDLKKARDYHAEMRFVQKKAYKEGVVNTARNMKAIGISIDKIIKATGLTKEQIQAL